MKQTSTSQKSLPPSPGMQRAFGIGRISFRKDGSKTRLKELHQSGSARVRVPRTHDGPPLGVLINTAGGITGGDRFEYEGAAEDGCHIVLSSQAAERAYKRTSGIGTVDLTLSVSDEGTLEWLPQETILFQESALRRSLTVNLSGSGRFVGLESVVLGRTAMGEEITDVHFADTWRIRRNDKLVFADNIKINGDARDILKKGATGEGAAAFATFVDVCQDAEEKLERARVGLENVNAVAAASAWNGVLVARFVATDGQALRTSLIHFLEHYRATALPRVWHC